VALEELQKALIKRQHSTHVHYAEKQMKVLVNSNCELSLLKKNEKVRAADD
jgi:hypothetical protein